MMRPAWAGRLPVTVLCGLTAGVLAKIGDETSWRWASDLGTYPSMWLFALVAIAVVAPSARRASVLGGAFSVAAIGSYYAWSSIVLGFPLGLFPLLWMGVAVTAAPAFTLATRLIRDRGGLLSAIGAAGVAGLMLADGPIQQYWNDVTIGLPDNFPFHPVQAVVSVALAITTVGLLVETAGRRAVAGALMIPSVIVASNSIDAVRSLVGI